jgi:hypothetical protein
VFFGKKVTGFGPHYCPYCNNPMVIGVDFFRDKSILIAALIGAAVLWLFIGFAGCLVSVAFLIVASVCYEKWLGK